MVWGQGEGFTGDDLSMEKFIMGEENFHERGTGFSSVIKKNKKLNKKKYVFQLKEKQH